jgi:dihydroorotate dehydrogenase electron transfer subunit
MSASPHAAHYADHIACVESRLEQIVEVARDTFRIRIPAPDIAARAIPGQFVMIRLTDRNAPLIGRALAIWDVIDDQSGVPHAIDLVFVKKGALTTPLSQAAVGTGVSLWGPLGNGFSNQPCDRLVIAAGGVGQTPMLMLARAALGQRNYGEPQASQASPRGENGWAKSVRIVYGARTADLLAGVDDFRAAGLDVRLCTDDGSVGEQGYVPDQLFLGLDEELSRDPAQRIRVVTCGPEIMMRKVAEGCQARGIPCEVSMETPMACGIGICFSCVAMVRETAGEPWDYKRTCVEGPVFDGTRIVW